MEHPDFGNTEAQAVANGGASASVSVHRNTSGKRSQLSTKLEAILKQWQIHVERGRSDGDDTVTLDRDGVVGEDASALDVHDGDVRDGQIGVNDGCAAWRGSATGEVRGRDQRRGP